MRASVWLNIKFDTREADRRVGSEFRGIVHSRERFDVRLKCHAASYQLFEEKERGIYFSPFSCKILRCKR